MYADHITDSMNKAISETNRRRAIQSKYNEEHGITPTTIQKKVRELIRISKKADKDYYKMDKDPESMSKKELEAVVKKITKDMHTAAAELNFELAAELRDRLLEIKKQLNDIE
jgi:excinuclease ABC subunit B